MSISNDLRQAVLQAAIQGKLTKQLPEDGNAKDLLEQIKAEKAKLIKEGKLKKEKALPEITEEEKPFDIPENWEWVRLGDILIKLTDGAHSTPKYFSRGVPFISVKDVSSGCISFADCKYISEQEHNELYKRCNPEKGDVLLTKVGTTGVPVIVDTDIEFSLFVSVALLKFNQSLIYNRYLVNLIKAPVVQKQAEVNTKGVGNKNWVMRDISNTILPLPPLAEQKRIVAKVEELMAKIDELEKTEQELEALKKAFPADMKASLLQAAMQGKLTEQLPEDGNAKDLLEKIKAEKAKLIKEGKLKKEKLLPEITEDEKPFDIPDNWEWVRLGEVTYNHGQKKPDGMFCYIDVGSINNKKCCLSTENNIVEPKDASSRARKIVRQNDVIYATIRPYLHNVSIIDREFPFETIASTAFAVMACCNGVNNKFLYYSLLSPMFDEYVNDSSNTKGVAYPAIGEKTFFDGIIPLPPLPEQKRIVEKLEKLLPLCDGLK